MQRGALPESAVGPSVAEERETVRIAAMLIFAILAMLAASASTHARLGSNPLAEDVITLSSR